MIEPEAITLYTIRDSAKNLLSQNWSVNSQTFNLQKSGWVFKYNDRKVSLGLCTYNKKTNEKIIYLSAYYLRTNLKDTWLDTMKHEIAHAIDCEIRGKSDHGPKWKSIAIQVGCNPKRCYDGPPLIGPKSKYTHHCDNCDNDTPSHRATGVKACGACCKKYNKGKYTEKYRLKVLKNY